MNGSNKLQRYITRIQKRLATDIHSSLLGPFVSYKENKVLRMWTLMYMSTQARNTARPRLNFPKTALLNAQNEFWRENLNPTKMSHPIGLYYKNMKIVNDDHK